jgi:hypothetical protein
VRIRLLPQNTRFYELFDAAAVNVEQAGRALHGLLAAFPDTRAHHEHLRDCEREGDRVTHELVRLLNSTYITPFDREDIFTLATVVDDVVDHLEEAANEVQLYGVRSIPDEALAQAGAAEEACGLLARVLRRLREGLDLREELAAIHRTEDHADGLARDALGRLFAGGADPLVVIRWKDIHEEIEEAVDSCQRAANVVETMLLKNR